MRVVVAAEQRYALHMRTRLAAVRSGVVTALFVAVAGCSAEKPIRSGTNTSMGTAGTASDSTSNGTAGKKGTDSPTDNPVPIMPMSMAGKGAGPAAGSGGGGAAEPLPSCVTKAQEAERVPVDMFIMLDRSSSMLEMTGTGVTKWDATRTALNMFWSDSRSSGLGVGLQYFPLGKFGVPTMCTMDSDCGADGGPCLIRACRPPALGSIPLIVCLSDADCPNDSPGCAPIGTCASDDAWCFDIGRNGCGLRDACTGVQGACYKFASCDAAVYSQPAVPISALPGNAAALSESLRLEAPIGRTPTSAALSGALKRAKEHAQAQPMHRVVAVLATDGTPTDCEPTTPASIGDLARDGFQGSPSIPTYVIGVFGPMETEARANLNTWALAGGTQSAFIIDPTQDVGKQLLDALEKIRSGSIACEYLLPPSPQGSQLDLDKVNVALVERQRTRDFLYVADQSRCGLTPLGWHYDADPKSGKATKIVACEQACNALKGTDGGRLEIRVGCKTMGPD